MQFVVFSNAHFKTNNQRSRLLNFSTKLLQSSSRFNFMQEIYHINFFLANASILYPLETTENQKFFGVFSGCKMGTLARKRLFKYTLYTWSNCPYHVLTSNHVFDDCLSLVSKFRCIRILRNFQE